MQHKKRTILVIDDDDMVLRVLCKGLERHGYEVVGVASVEKALAVGSLRECDMILCDLFMPTTFDVEDLVRELGPEGVKVILISGMPRSEIPWSCLACVCGRFLSKPLSWTEIDVMMSTVMHSRPTRQLRATGAVAKSKV